MSEIVSSMLTAGTGRLMTMREVAAALTLHRATIYRLIRAGEFPPGKPITQSRVVWTERDVEAWKCQRLQQGPS